MALSVDTRKVVRARVVPWEDILGLYGVAWETADGRGDGRADGGTHAARLRMRLSIAAR